MELFGCFMGGARTLLKMICFIDLNGMETSRLAFIFQIKYSNFC
jgi:hypothetical protein